jgi:hypothetical protein
MTKHPNLKVTRKSAAIAGAAAFLAAGGLVAAIGVSADGEPSVETATFTNVVTYTVPTVTETSPLQTVTVTQTVTTSPPPTTTAPPAGVTLQPGQSWDAAYEAAAPGDTIWLAAGNHGTQQIISTKGNRDGLATDVTFRPVAGAAVRVDDLDLYAPHITVRNLDIIGLSIDGYDNRNGGDILVEDSRVRSGDLTSAWNVTYRRVDFGPNREGVSSQYPWPQDALIVNNWPSGSAHRPKNLLIEDSRFHDVTEPTSDAHSDCLQFTAGENVVIRRTEFYRCEHADIMLAPDQGAVLNWRLEHSTLYPTISAFYTVNADHKGKDSSWWSGVQFYCNDSTIVADYPVVDNSQPIRRTAPTAEYVAGPC